MASLITYSDDLEPAALGRYVEKMGLIGIQTCPFKITDVNMWSIDNKEWPQLSWQDVYHYLIKSPRESMVL